jgi:hypothetical protein
MIIHATARDTTMLQAVAHNIHTSASDLETLARVLGARGQLTEENASMFAAMIVGLQDTEADLLELFTEAVERHPHTAGDHSACDAAPHGATVAEHTHTA